MKNNIVFAVTPGDPDGIGYEITAKALASREVKTLPASFIVVGDLKTFKSALAALDRKLEILDMSQFDREPQRKVYFCDMPMASKRLAQKTVFDSIVKAVNLVSVGTADGIVTGPVSKARLNSAGIPFIGHTELIANLSNSKAPLMVFVSESLKVGLVTTHISIRRLPLYLKKERILSAIIAADLGVRKYFGIAAPRIAVCGLNPHAGEEGLFGNEEKKSITPAVVEAKKFGVDCLGPFPADSVFHYATKGRYDLVLAMYHDQGLIPMKLASLFTAVNVTFGLPFVRTSPAHGTAFDIAGTESADPSSMVNSILTAHAMAVSAGKSKLFN